MLMKVSSYREFFRVGILALIVVISAATSSFAQALGSMHGTVTDPSGAAVTKADVQITGPDGKALNTTTNNTGGYEVKGLAAGKYGIKVSAKGFELYDRTLTSRRMRSGWTRRRRTTLHRWC
jgi:hypothetical protein